MKIDRIHHVAYRCKDAKTTVDWYVKHLNMTSFWPLPKTKCPAPRHPTPYIICSSMQAVFWPSSSCPMRRHGRDTNTRWVQHIAFKVDSVRTLEDTKRRKRQALK